MTALPAISRPAGALYRPRKVVAYALTDRNEACSGVVVFGTHDIGRARDLATQLAEREMGRGWTAVDPVTVWWRDGFEGGCRMWITDEAHGRAGTWFRDVVEVTD